jgi:hypothetical protein
MLSLHQSIPISTPFILPSWRHILLRKIFTCSVKDISSSENVYQQSGNYNLQKEKIYNQNSICVFNTRLRNLRCVLLAKLPLVCEDISVGTASAISAVFRGLLWHIEPLTFKEFTISPTTLIPLSLQCYSSSFNSSCCHMIFLIFHSCNPTYCKFSSYRLEWKCWITAAPVCLILNALF